MAPASQAHLTQAGQPLWVLAAAGLGDLPNARALFERALTDTPPEAAPQLWDAFLRFEHEVGTTAAIQVTVLDTA